MLGDGARTDLADRGLHILLRDCRNHLFRVHPLRRHALGIEPHANRQTRSVNRRLTDARDSQEHRLHVAVEVVGDLLTGHRALRGMETDESELILALRTDLPPELSDLSRQLSLGLGDAVLNLHHVHIAVGLDLEADCQLVAAVIGTRTGHVKHVVDAVHRILNRHRDRIHNRRSISAIVVVRHADGRRRKPRIL